MRKPIIVAAAVLLMVLAMVLAMAAEPTPGAVSLGGTLQEPAITLMYA